MPLVLVATDGSAPARAAESVGVDLARSQAAPIVFASVWAPLRGSFGLPIPEFIDPEFIDAEKDWAQKSVDEAEARARSAGLQVEKVVAKGDTVEAVCRIARERSASWLVAGWRGWGAVASLVLGRTTLGFLQHAPCPVIVVRDTVGTAANEA